MDFTEEAPPGFEPGMADLQSAALAAWLRRQQEPLLTSRIRFGETSCSLGKNFGKSPLEKNWNGLSFIVTYGTE